MITAKNEKPIPNQDRLDRKIKDYIFIFAFKQTEIRKQNKFNQKRTHWVVVSRLLKQSNILKKIDRNGEKLTKQYRLRGCYKQ